MAFLYRGQLSTAENPVLDLYTSFNSVLIDVYQASFAIYDVSTPVKMTEYTTGTPANVQIYPAPPGSFYSIDVTRLASDPVTPGHKLETGHYYAPWTAPADVATGNYVIAWKYKASAAAVEQFHQEEFVVVAQADVAGTGIAEKLRLYMLDYFSRNELIDKIEYTPQQYDFALEQSAWRFNAITPMTTYDVESFPAGAIYLLLIGGAGHLLRSTSIEQLRNQLTYTDGNIHVGLTDKHQLYQAAASQHLGEFDSMGQKIKMYMNNESAWGDVPSPYLSINGFFGTGGLL